MSWFHFPTKILYKFKFVHPDVSNINKNETDGPSNQHVTLTPYSSLDMKSLYDPSH
jgi:hypothetical protein